tara:strand:- start:1267 stop:2244 length:978 start_codon:yes stop_codon:yes gene_type:complete
MKKIEIFCTLGPSSLNRSFLNFAEKNKVSLVRLNMSHLSLQSLEKSIIFIKKNSNLKICIDTEGAQIRTKLKTKSLKIKKGQLFYLYKNKGKFKLYPEVIFEKLKSKDVLDIGFNNLLARIEKKTKDKISLKCLTSGHLENNKGVYVQNRNIDINFLTKKDILAIQIAKKYKINNYALSFTNTTEDIVNFKKIIKNSRAIFKIETKKAINNLNKLLRFADDFLIDRGDLSKEIKIENVPIIQRKIFNLAKKYKNKKIAIATNFLESMIEKPFPTRAEVNDIFNACEMKASGLVLAAETAIGKYPKECVSLLKRIIKVFKKSQNIK